MPACSRARLRNANRGIIYRLSRDRKRAGIGLPCDDILFPLGHFGGIVKTRSLSLLLVIAAASVLASSPSAELRKLPLRFEENQGRDLHPGVKFVARSSRFLLGLAPTESWLEWKNP